MISRILRVVAGFLWCWLGACVLCLAQAASSPWAGEWGQFKQVPSTSNRRFEGHGLSIHDCVNRSCAFTILVENKTSHAGATGFLQLESRTEAIAHLVEGKKEYCSLQIALDADQPSIAVRQENGGCSYFETPGANFVETYPLHTRVRYYGWDVAGCFAATDGAKIAVCNSRILSAQQSSWQKLFLAVTDDLQTSSGLADWAQEQSAQDSLMQSCEGAAHVVECLTTAFANSARELDHRKAVWLKEVTAPGDRATAIQKAAMIAGSYRYSFPSGDVYGNHYQATDTLNIEALHNGVVHFAVDLSFYNGHACSLKGRATYRHAGYFVYQQATGEPRFPLCIFEILPEKDGVKLVDPTGACKMVSCGERGGYNGAYFPFKDRR